MNIVVEELPSGDVKLENCNSRVKECEEYLLNSQWVQFQYLFKQLIKFNEKNRYEIPEAFSTAFDTMKKSAISHILKNLEIANIFEDFKVWFQRLSEVVSSKEELWNIIHTQANMSIRVTMRQNQELVSLFFTPETLFEYGIKPFMESNVCDFKNVMNEENLIDNFYGVAGFVRACGLSTTFESNNQDYFNFVEKILVNFVNLPDFDPHRFVWLVEACNGNLKIPPATFREICQNTIEKFSQQEFKGQLMQKLYKFCVLSTSPLMQTFPVIQRCIDDTYVQLIEEQRSFSRRYIFSQFTSIEWNGKSTGQVCDQLKCWTLFVSNVSLRLADKPELPKMILQDLLDDSMSFFEGFFADAQPTKEKAIDMRCYILHIAETIEEFYPGPIPQNTIYKVWYILFIAAIAGALEHELNDIHYADAPKPDTPTLGLEHSATDFTSYTFALSVLSKKFEVQNDTFTEMFAFIRQNIKYP
ncbi:hypothetical protein TVAG_044070 [Trichomonas vaginalis G3]|uniref:Uncharacterized protein n=1 Tax=Trichomonas vaginalis (strain ATCC PRA-98 / G3) TaxID=412133 RepID=A2E0G7_TRIV3|nr:hypothetical protein TVAGG3_0541280 [Trichomonas vaginalis G3]EAY13847.1 hypothetical protein TVAG_044070 [Trichomonas vaginalis G3]KAI5519856.1 hypothetical protein TVAGG3_0541280 [Trichomonas vaginalis G3]|eukprot:XP_001326070.1 hypothetical protein [Trichomonas vaginalis G3]